VRHDRFSTTADGNPQIRSLMPGDLLIRNQQFCSRLLNSMLTECVLDPQYALLSFFVDLMFPQAKDRPAHLLELARSPFITRTIRNALG
jgi:hypothetical protein